MIFMECDHMNELKIKVIGFLDNGIAELYLYYLNNDENIVATIAVNNQGDLIGNILDEKYNNIIVSDINILTGYNFEIEDNYYINNNEVVWNNTKKFINDNNLNIIYKSEIDIETKKLNRNIY